MTTALALVSVAVHDLSTAIETYRRRLGLEPVGEVRDSPRGLGLRWIELGVDGNPVLELIAPTEPDSAVARFLARHGEGVYQVRLSVDDVTSALDRVEQSGGRAVRDSLADPTQPELGWVHPSATHGVLFELIGVAE